MFIKKMSLPRRTFLRGMGTALALPFIDAMVPALSAAADAAKPVRRLGFQRREQALSHDHVADPARTNHQDRSALTHATPSVPARGVAASLPL